MHKAKIFISYSRRNKAFTQKLFDELKSRGYDPWVDWDDIPFSVDWWQEIQDAIDEHDVMIIVVSNASMTSRVVSQELKYAREINKRIIPLIIEQVDVKYVVGELYDQAYEMDARDNWKYIRTLNWIYFYRENDSFEGGVDGIVSAVEADYDYLREHTRILTRAQEWNDNNRGDGFLLKGEELAEAERWLVRAVEQKRMPVPTNLHREYIEGSRQAEDNQKAQIEALRRQTRRSATWTAVLILTAAVVIPAILFALAQQQRQNTDLQLERDRIRTQSAESLLQQETAESRFARQSTEAALERQTIRTESANAVASQQAVIREIELARQQSEALRLASESENALENGDPNLFAIPLALAAHRVVENGEPPLRVGRILANSSYRPGLVQFFMGEGEAATAHDRAISKVIFSTDDELLLSASQDRTVRIWDAKTGELIRSLEGHAGRVTSVAITNDRSRIASGDDEGVIILWDVSDGTLLQRINNAHNGRVTDIAFAPDGAQFVSTSADTTVRVWSTEDGEQVRLLQFHGNRVTHVAYHPNGSEFITGDANGRIIVWNASNSFFRRDETRHLEAITGIAYAPDGSSVLTSSQDGRFIHWLSFTSDQRDVYDTFRGEPLTDIGFINDDTALIGMENSTLLMWDLRVLPGEDGEIRRLLLPGQPTTVNAITIDSGGRFAGVAYNNNRLATWEVINGALQNRIKIKSLPVTDAAVTPNRELIFRYFDPEGTFVFLASDGTLTTKTRQSLGIASAALHPDGETAIVRMTESSDLVRLNLNNEEIVDRYELDIAVAGTVFSPDGSLAVSSSNLPANAPAGSLGTSTSMRVVWDIDSGEVLKTVSDSSLLISDSPANIAFNLDNRRLATVSNSQDLIVFEVATGDIIGQFNRDRDITAVAFGKSNTVITGYADGGIALFRSENEDWRDLRAHTAPVTDIATDAAGEFILTSSTDGTAVIWDIDLGEPIRIFETDTSSVSGVLFTPDGEAFVTRSSDGVVNYWRFDDDSTLIDWVQQNRFIQPFSASDCRTFQIPDPC